MKKSYRDLLGGFFCATILLLVFSQVACNDKSLHKALRANSAVAAGLEELQSQSIAAHSAGELDDAEAVAIVSTTLDALKASRELNHVLSQSSQLDPKTRGAALQQLNLIVQSLQRLSDEKVLHVKNESARKRLSAILIAVNVSLSALQAVFQ